MLRMLLLLLLVFSVSAGSTATEHAGTYCTAVYGSTVSIFGTVVAGKGERKREIGEHRYPSRSH